MGWMDGSFMPLVRNTSRSSNLRAEMSCFISVTSSSVTPSSWLNMTSSSWRHDVVTFWRHPRDSLVVVTSQIHRDVTLHQLSNHRLHQILSFFQIYPSNSDSVITTTLLTTRETAWYIGRACMSVYLCVCLYVCRTISFKSLDVGVHICTGGISPRSTSRVRIWRSSGQGQGHRDQKGRKSLFPQCKLWLAITSVL